MPGFGSAFQWTRFSSILATLFFAISNVHGLVATSGHTENGTNWDKDGISTYARMKHGPDGALFLDPYFLPYLFNLDGQILLDAGCGAGPWGIIAAKNGAIVYGIDIQSGMIEKSKQAAREELVENTTSFVVGDLALLPYPDNFFDRAISINVGCNLPSLEPHLQELNRVLKKGGVAIITAPTSFGTVFTDGKRLHEEVINSINQSLMDHQVVDQDSFLQTIQGLDEIYRATFAKKQGQWSLVVDEAVLESGEQIWRKLPMMMVPNHYHSEHEYTSLFIKEGFDIKQVYRSCFANEQEREKYNENRNDTLGNEYVMSPAFVVFVVEKS